MIRVVACLPLLASAAFGQKPSFIVIFVDDLGYGDLSGYGSRTIRAARLFDVSFQADKTELVP